MGEFAAPASANSERKGRELDKVEGMPPWHTVALFGKYKRDVRIKVIAMQCRRSENDLIRNRHF